MLQPLSLVWTIEIHGRLVSAHLEELVALVVEKLEAFFQVPLGHPGVFVFLYIGFKHPVGFVPLGVAHIPDPTGLALERLALGARQPSLPGALGSDPLAELELVGHVFRGHPGGAGAFYEAEQLAVAVPPGSFRQRGISRFFLFVFQGCFGRFLSLLVLQ